MKIKYINIDKIYKNLKKIVLIFSMSTLIGCSNKKEPEIIPIEPEITLDINDIETEETLETTSSITEESIEETEKKEKKIVALTFDDGPSKYTKDLVDALKENNATATFFVVGTNINSYSSSIQYAYESGNEIAIHGYSHTSFNSMSVEEVQNEIDITKQLVNSCGAECSNLVRPPYGNINNEVINNIDSTFILWNVDPRDWESRDKEKIKQEIIGKINDGDIVLFHDLYGSTVDALKEILPELSNEYEFVTVSELFRLKEIEYEENNKYYKAK